LLIGTARFLRAQGIAADEDKGDALAEAGKTPIYVAVDGQFAGIIAVADPVKAHSRTAIKRLQDAGLQSGDDHR
jgi:Cu+-exporting ATPase